MEKKNKKKKIMRVVMRMVGAKVSDEETGRQLTCILYDF